MTVLDAAAQRLTDRLSGALATVLPDGTRALFDAAGDIVAGSLPESVAGTVGEVVPDMIRRDASGMVVVGAVEVFVESLVPPPRLALFGAGPIAEALCAIAALAGFAVEVADPRPAFARPERFPAASSVTCGWPDEVVASAALDDTTYVVSLLHEARFEDDLLPAVLRSPARYVGALGSTRTHEARVSRLQERGFTEEDTARISGPVGLSIGARTPEEIAVAILAEIVAERRGAARTI